jgi:hypothetical protein
MTAPREKYQLTVEALPDAAPAIVRLRRVIKALLRSYGFRLLAAVQLREDAVTAEPIFVPKGGNDVRSR